MTAEEEIRSDVSPIRRGSPLPWLLLGVTLLTGGGMVVMGKNRINDEKLRTANALKASDEVMSRLRTVVSENQTLSDGAKELSQQKLDADEKIKRLNDQLALDADELAKFKSNPKCVPKK